MLSIAEADEQELRRVLAATSLRRGGAALGVQSWRSIQSSSYFASKRGAVMTSSGAAIYSELKPDQSKFVFGRVKAGKTRQP